MNFNKHFKTKPSTTNQVNQNSNKNVISVPMLLIKASPLHIEPKKKINAEISPLKLLFLKSVTAYSGHGITNIFNNTNILRSFTWAFIFLLCFSGCCYYVVSTLSNFFAYDIISNVRDHDAERLLFPAVIFCNWYNDRPILQSIFFCEFNQHECQLNKNMDRTVVIGGGMSGKKNCLRFNGDSFLNNQKPVELLHANHPGYDDGLNIKFFLDQGVS